MVISTEPVVCKLATMAAEGIFGNMPRTVSTYKLLVNQNKAHPSTPD